MTATIARPRQPHSDWLARLRTIMVLRPGQRVVHLPGIGVTTSRRAVSASGANWWEAGGATGCIAAYQPKGAASLAASYVNLANPGTYDAAPGVAPAWNAATGWTGNTSAAYLRTGLVPQNSWSAILRFSNCTVASDYNCMVGCYAGPGAFLISPNLAGGGRTYWQRDLFTAGASVVAGVMGMSPGRAYLNGAYDGDITQVNNVPTTEIYVGGAVNFANSPNLGSRANTLAVAIYNTTLTAPQVAAVSAAMAAL